MAPGSHDSRMSLVRRSSFATAQGQARWVSFSALVHIGLVLSLWAIPYGPARSPSFPVYTVDLVGGEKIGGTIPATRREEKPNSLNRQRTDSSGQEPAALIQPKQKHESKSIENAEKSAKKEKVKAAEKAVKTQETGEAIALKGARKEKTLPYSTQEPVEVSEPAKELPSQLREKLIQSALDRLKERAQKPPSSSKDSGGGPSAPRTSSGQGEGATVLGRGGSGGGTVRGIEFISYFNRMRQLIKERWTWSGKRPDLEVTVSFGVQENGQIVGLRVTRGSGDPSYDDSVVRAVTRASPLPPPPESHRSEFMDVQLAFRPQDLN